MKKLLLLLTSVPLLLLACAVPALADTYYQVSPVRRLWRYGSTTRP